MPEPEVPAATTELAAEVTHAVTVQGAQLALAMLRGLKLLENRNFRLRLGWHALHLGLKRGTEHGLRAARLYQQIPRDEEVLDHFGAIVGLIRVSEHRNPTQCNGVEWAIGPCCNVISHAVKLAHPVSQAGQQGCWRLRPTVQEEIRRQVLADPNGIEGFDLSYLGPRPVGPLGPLRRARSSGNVAQQKEQLAKPPVATDAPRQTASDAAATRNDGGETGLGNSQLASVDTVARRGAGVAAAPVRGATRKRPRPAEALRDSIETRAGERGAVVGPLTAQLKLEGVGQRVAAKEAAGTGGQGKHSVDEPSALHKKLGARQHGTELRPEPRSQPSP